MASKIKPELNLIYTEQPFDTPEGADCGWFCREHAYHLYFLLHLWGFKCRICKGHILVISNRNYLTTISTDTDHAWCEAEEVQPIDLSMTLKYFQDFEDVSLIFGKGRSEFSVYDIQHMTKIDNIDLKEYIESKEPRIIYFRSEEMGFSSEQLLDNPYSLLHRPRSGTIGFIEYHGNEILDMITMHCNKLALGIGRPLFGIYDRVSAIRRIKKQNIGAQEEIRRLILTSDI